MPDPASPALAPIGGSALVTGAFGFLGGAIATKLEADGWNVVRTGRPAHEIPSAPFDALLREASPDLVVHCASPASVPASVADPEADRAGSVVVLDQLLRRLAVLSTVPRVLLLSSAAVYGQPERLPVGEADPLAPISPYGQHRAASEALLREYANANDVAVASLRVFSAYGEGLARQVLWDICTRALAGGPVVLAGTGAESRDFIHARDVARAVALVARQSEPGQDVYNVATGEELTIAKLAALLLGGLEVETDVVFSGETRIGDPDCWRADIGRLRSLGFEVTVPIEAGVRSYAQWVRATVASEA